MPRFDVQAVPCVAFWASYEFGVWNHERREAEIEVTESLSWRLEIEAVEDVLLIAMIVEDLIFRAIQKAARVQTIGGDEVSPRLLP